MCSEAQRYGTKPNSTLFIPSPMKNITVDFPWVLLDYYNMQIVKNRNLSKSLHQLLEPYNHHRNHIAKALDIRRFFSTFLGITIMDTRHDQMTTLRAYHIDFRFQNSHRSRLMALGCQRWAAEYSNIEFR